eukprot:m.131392 g.131392  ORF g.131392 m.131392 type:complete len:647 (-) comp13915_c0_seq1:8599-10539(-)
MGMAYTLTFPSLVGVLLMCVGCACHVAATSSATTTMPGASTSTSTNSTATLPPCGSPAPTESCLLTQELFDSGTVILAHSGVYVLASDIVFNPNPRSAGGDGIPLPSQSLYKSRAFVLGFFAAIMVKGADITLDLGGFEIRQSREHYLRQRFYAHIEVSSSPFVPGQGPATFATEDEPVVKAERVVIRNGRLGLTSHHGIHGNSAVDVVVQNVVVHDFEVAGIHINGGKNVQVVGCEVGPSARNVPVLSYLSHMLFIRPYVRAIVAAHPTGKIKLNRTAIFGEKILADLESVIETTHLDANGHPKTLSPFIVNPTGMPDGGSVYGMVFNTRGVAVNGISNKNNQPTINIEIVVMNTIVHDIAAEPHEFEGLAINKHDFRPQTDPIGALFDHRLAISGEQVVSHPLTNAQLFVAKHCNRISSEFDCSRLSITKDTIDWFAYPARAKRFLRTAPFVCGGDSMFHNAKGVFGIRVDAAYSTHMQNVSITNLNNTGAVGSTICGAGIDGSNQHGSATEPGYLGSRTIGVNIAASIATELETVRICGVHSENGNAMGLRVHFGSAEVVGNALVSTLSVGNKELPAGTPQQPPSTHPFVLDDVSNMALATMALDAQECPDLNVSQDSVGMQVLHTHSVMGVAVMVVVMVAAL